MKNKSLVTFALLFVMGFSLIHEYIYVSLDEDHCTITEYVMEFSASNNHGDICDIHFEYHQSFLMPQSLPFPQNNKLSSKLISQNEHYKNNNIHTFLKPPIV